MDVDVVERAIKASLEEALKRARRAEEGLKRAQQGRRGGGGDAKLAEALEEYARCVAELTYYLRSPGRDRDTDA